MTKTQAEAAKFAAEAEAARAEARKAEAEARKIEIELAKAEEAERKRLCSDDHHHVYHFRGTVDPGSVKKCCDELTVWHRLDPTCSMDVVFFSPGGYVHDGMALFDFLQDVRQLGHRLTTGCTGYAASMAGILLQAGDRRWMHHQSLLMIHKAAFGAVGKSDEIEDELKLVRRIERRIVDIFVSRSGGRLSRDMIRRNWSRKDWWIEPEQALKYGLVDEVRGVLPEHERASELRGVE